MPRRTTVTVAATAVTLTILGASLYASPPVIAETLGREVETFSPLKPQTYPVQEEPSEFDTNVTAADGREYSVLQTPSVEPEVEAAAQDHVPQQQVERLSFAPEAVDQTVDEESATTPEVLPSDLPTVEVELPEVVVEEPANEDLSEAEALIPEDLDSPESLTVIVNKHRPLPADYEPVDLVDLPGDIAAGSQRLRKEAAEAAQEMLTAAAADDIRLTVISAYRSYGYQQRLYDNYVAQYGVAATNEISARPGHSEHQTGLAIDIDTPSGEHRLKTSFGDTAAGQWVAEHAHEYGFVIRYPQDQQDTTGFHYEPWHLRYFGVPYAQQIAENSGVAEQEFNLRPAPGYED